MRASSGNPHPSTLNPQTSTARCLSPSLPPPHPPPSLPSPDPPSLPPPHFPARKILRYMPSGYASLVLNDYFQVDSVVHVCSRVVHVFYTSCMCRARFHAWCTRVSGTAHLPKDLTLYSSPSSQDPAQDPEVGLCPGLYGDHRGGALSYERGAPVGDGRARGGESATSNVM